MSISPRRIADNLANIRARIARAAEQCGRSPDDILLVAVTKYVTATEAVALRDAGCSDFGESRPQELWSKADDPRLQGVRWHLVGHLQRNKVRRTLPYLSLVHSVDSERLARAIDENVPDNTDQLRVLVEVNCSGDEEKHGVPPSAVEPLVERLLDLKRLHLGGLMTMAARGGDRDAARRNFALLREIRDRVLQNLPECGGLPELSMGMSGDFEEAIYEGATMVRVGSALFQ